MKFTIPLTVLAVAVSVEANCSSPGQACDTVKRAADAFANELQSSSRLPARDESDSETAFIARRQINELAFAIAASQADPVGFYNALHFGAPPPDETGEDAGAEKRSIQGTATTGDVAARAADAEPAWCTRFLGQPCWKKRDAASAGSPTTRELAARAAEPEPACTRFLGQSCWKKRKAASAGSPTTRELAARAAEPEPACTKFLGQSCWKKKRFEDRTGAVAVAVAKRAPEAEPQGWCSRFLGQPCWKRSAEAEAEAEAEPKGWCSKFLGQSCWKKSKRAAEAEAEADPQGWCTIFVGQPCWKRDAPAAEKREAQGWCSRFLGQSCWKRDGSAAAAEEKKRCLGEGQSCWRAKRAALAVINAIDEGNAHTSKREADPACNAPDGACTKATRDLHAMYNAARSIIEA